MLPLELCIGRIHSAIMNKTQFTKISSRDLETRLTDDDHHALRVWLKLLSTSQLIENNIRELLRVNFDITLPRFDLMAQLYRHCEGLSMSSLAELMMVSGGNVTNIVKQLERDGLVTRTPQKQDNRSFIVNLSNKGKAEFEKMAPTHEQWITMLTDGLEADELQSLINNLDKLKAHIKASGAQK